MIRKLRLRLVSASILSLAVVLAVIITAVGIMNYRTLTENADSTLALLQENDGNFAIFLDDAPGSGSEDDTFEDGNFEDGNFEDGKDGSRSNNKKSVDSEDPDSGNADSAEEPPEIPDDDSAVGEDPAKSDGKSMSKELPFESRYFTVILDSDGDVLSADLSRIAAVDEETAEAYAAEVAAKGDGSGFYEDYRYLTYTEDDSTYVIFLDCGRTLSSFRSFIFTSILVSVVGLLAVLLLLIFLSHRIVRPFAESYEKQRRFITDAGHELKTPLTIIDADTEILEMDFGESEWLTDIQAQTKRLADLTNHLILLSRMEEEQPKVQMIDFPLSDLAEETADGFQALAKTQGKSLNVSIQPMITLYGDESSIQRLLTIFLDNAMKYSNDGGSITLSLEQQRNSIILKVSNTADHIDRESLPHLFDRFYRTDSSRNSQTGGFGLGLSIAAATVKTHKGKIKATTEDGKSLTITVTLPASSGTQHA